MSPVKPMPISIALGCDGVLADFHAGMLSLIHEVTGKYLSLSNLTESDSLAISGLSPVERACVKKALDERLGFAVALRPYPRARQGVRRLRTLGRVFCVTTPWQGNPWWQAERESWLALHFGIDQVHHSVDNDKTRYEADVFVDDCARHVQGWLTAWPKGTAVLWRALHNSGAVVPPGAHQITSWEALYELVKQIPQIHASTREDPA